MNIFLAGASGLVGSAFARAAARRGHRVTGIVGSFDGPIEGLHKKLKLDLTDDVATTSAVLEAFPEAIVNCAAISVPEQCEAKPVLAYAMNVTLPATLARLAHHVSARFIHLSSEQVFDGTSGKPYSAGDAVLPINLYAQQKIESEQRVHDVAPTFAVTLRVPLLTGNSATGQRSLHERLLLDWSAGKTPRLFVDEFRQPCSAENLAEVLVEMCERRDVLGIQHWAGTELLSRHALGVRVRERFKLTELQAPIVSVKRTDVPEAAKKRQPSLALNIAPLTAKLKTRPQSLAEQLDELKVPAPVRAWYCALGE
ncbi:MAG: sugar nucleotide-binding protein [Verrucomicrobiota bacterium]